MGLQPHEILGTFVEMENMLKKTTRVFPTGLVLTLLVKGQRPGFVKMIGLFCLEGFVRILRW
jgi:hypothetical protein